MQIQAARKHYDECALLFAGWCKVPVLEHGNVTDHQVGEVVPHGTTLSVVCTDSYRLHAPSPRCEDGVWIHLSACAPSKLSLSTYAPS